MCLFVRNVQRQAHWSSKERRSAKNVYVREHLCICVCKNLQGGLHCGTTLPTIFCQVDLNKLAKLVTYTLFGACYQPMHGDFLSSSTCKVAKSFQISFCSEQVIIYN